MSGGIPRLAAVLLALVAVTSRVEAVSPDDTMLALTDATIYPSPAEAPIARGVVLIRNGKIVAAGPTGKLPVPEDAKRVDCQGLVVVAGFQNSHVHFTEPKWEGAATLPAAQLSAQLEDMLLRWGVTTVVDTGSLLANTLALRTRIESGEVRGPRIYTVGTPIYPHAGHPLLPARIAAARGAPAPQYAADGRRGGGDHRAADRGRRRRPQALYRVLGRARQGAADGRRLSRARRPTRHTGAESSSSRMPRTSPDWSPRSRRASTCSRTRSTTIAAGTSRMSRV